jgi:hypothetical protein
LKRSTLLIFAKAKTTTPLAAQDKVGFDFLQIAAEWLM